MRSLKKRGPHVLDDLNDLLFSLQSTAVCHNSATVSALHEAMSHFIKEGVTSPDKYRPNNTNNSTLTTKPRYHKKMIVL